MSKKLNHFKRMSHLMDSMGITEPTKTSFQFGAEAEQERIIKLLESDPEDIIASGGGLRAGYETAIALIKGEK